MKKLRHKRNCEYHYNQPQMNSLKKVLPKENNWLLNTKTKHSINLKK